MPAHAEVVGVAHSRAPRVSRNRGIMRNSNSSSDYDSASMCANPSPHMGARPPRTMITGKAHNPGKNQLPAHKGSSLPCATPKIPTPTTPRVEIGPVPARDRSDSARPTRRRGAHDELGGEGHMPRFGAVGEQQICSSATDLDTGYDRSRAGSGPISVRSATDLGGLRRLRRPRSSWDPQSARGGPTPAGSGPPRRVHRSRAR